MQAAEARINEANAGLSSEVEENEDLDVPLHQVFSERQRYGRVARYELRPGRYGQAAAASTGLGEHQNDPRRSPDFSLVRKTANPTAYNLLELLGCNLLKLGLFYFSTAILHTLYTGKTL